MYLIRLDDASEHMYLDNWIKIKKILDDWNVKPIYGIIPKNSDPELLKFEHIPHFWTLMKQWQSEGWIPALHGYEHICISQEGGINPIHNRSEFAGVDLDTQCMKIREGYDILIDNNIKANIFFAPAHTFDDNTVEALKKETPIRVISDTIANNIYYQNGIHYIPQQCGACRRLPLSLVTFCYHPNNMQENDFRKLEMFLAENQNKFIDYSDTLIRKKRNYNLLDYLLKKIYFVMRKIKK